MNASRMFGLSLLFAAFALIVGCSCLLGQNADAALDTHKHLAEIAASLPPGSNLRRQLEAGDHGDGVREKWMDPMNQQGVKRALVSVEFTNKDQPEGMRLKKIIFYDKYGSNCAQITNRNRIEKFRADGLTSLLEQQAILLTKKSGKWLSVDNRAGVGGPGVSYVEFYDDPWLLNSVPALGSNRGPETLLQIVSDESEVRNALATKRLTGGRLDEALLTASAIIDDSCVLKPLIAAGANPNAMGKDGNTALMNAAGAGLIVNVSVLLEAGADPTKKDLSGRTALAIANERPKPNPEIVSLLEKPKSAIR
jgi:hypothetical protein